MATLRLAIDPTGMDAGGRKAESALDRVKREAGQTERAVEKTGTRGGAALGKLGKAAGAAAVAMVSLAAVAAFSRNGIRNALDFGAALAEVSTLIEGTAQQTTYLEAESKRLAATYGGTGITQANAFYQAISAGAKSVEDAGKTLAVANQLAIGGVTDVTTAVGILSTAMNVYAASGLTAAEASDAIFVAVKAGVTTVGELSSALGKVLPLAEKMGLTFDETAAAVAALTKGGLSTAEAVTGLRASLAAVLGPTTQAQKLAKQLGLDFSAAGLEAKGFAGFMAEVVDKTGGSAESMQQLFGSVEAVGSALAFSGSAGKSMAEILEDMENKAGSTSEAFNKLSEDRQQRLSVVMGDLWGRTTSFGSALLTVLVPALEAAAAVMGLVADNADILGFAVAGLVYTQLPALGTMLLRAGFAMTSYASLTTAATIATTALSAAMRLIPFVAVVAGATALYRHFKNQEDAATASEAAFASFTQTTKELKDVVSTLEGNYDSLTKAKETMTAATKNGTAVERNAAREAVEGINSQILANENLRRELAITQQSELIHLKQKQDAAQEYFENQSAWIAARELMLAENAGSGIFGLDDELARNKLKVEGIEAVTSAYHDFLDAQTLAGVELTSTQEKWLASSAAVETTRINVDNAAAALDGLNTPAGLADLPGQLNKVNTALAATTAATYTAIPALSELQAQYGPLAESMRGVLEAQNKVAEADFNVMLSGIAGTAGEVANLAKELGQSKDYVADLQSSFANISKMDTFEAQAIALSAMADHILDVGGGLENLPPEARALYIEVLSATEQAASLAVASGQINFGTAISGAQRLAEWLGISLATAQALASMGPQGVPDVDENGMVYGRVGARGDPREMGGSAYDIKNREAAEFLANWKPPTLGGVSAAGGGGGVSEATKAADAIKALRTEYSNLQATIGMTDQQQKVYNAQQDLGTSATEAQKDEVSRLIPLMDTIREKTERVKSAMEDMRSSMSSAFVGLATGAKSLKSAISDLLMKFAEMVASSAFDALWSGIGGGTGGIFSTIASAIGGGDGGALSFAGGGYTGSGSRSGGVDGIGGFPALLHPNETVIDHTRGQSAGSNTTNININIDGANGDQHVIDLVKQGVSQGMSQVRQEVPGIMQNYQKRAG